MTCGIAGGGPKGFPAAKPPVRYGSVRGGAGSSGGAPRGTAYAGGGEDGAGGGLGGECAGRGRAGGGARDRREPHERGSRRGAGSAGGVSRGTAYAGGGGGGEDGAGGGLGGECAGRGRAGGGARDRRERHERGPRGTRTRSQGPCVTWTSRSADQTIPQSGLSGAARSRPGAAGGRCGAGKAVGLTAAHTRPVGSRNERRARPCRPAPVRRRGRGPPTAPACRAGEPAGAAPGDRRTNADEGRSSGRPPLTRGDLRFPCGTSGPSRGP
ncbi:hypothetical protein SCANM63S_00355 [Streptomyces canarius]